MTTWENYDFESLFVCTSKPFEGQDSLLELFELVDDIERPDAIVNQLAEIDASQPEESSLTFSKGDPEEYAPRKEGSNAAIIDVGNFGDESEELLHFHIDISSTDLVDDFTELFFNVISVLENVELRGLGVNYSTDQKLSDFKLPVHDETDFEIHGIRLSEDDYHYLFQDLREFGDENRLIFQRYTQRDFVIDSTNVESLIENELEAGIEFVRGRER